LIRDAVAADGPVLTGIVRGSSAYAGEYRAMVKDLSVAPGASPASVIRLWWQDGIRGFYLLLMRPQDCELDMLFVANGHHGKGLGRRLFADMADVARTRGYGEVTIISHPPAAGFYERMGARRAGVEPPAGHVTWARPRFVLGIA
jgi:GNAT superfamily N-acetyltransferase